MEEKITSRSRTDHLVRFYAAIEHLKSGVGGKRRLSSCNGAMNWPKRGVYFFFENGEKRSRSGNDPRIVRVGTHAVSSGSRTTLWNRLSTHRGPAKTGGGNHRGSIFRLLVGEALIERDPECRVDTWGKGPSAPSDVRIAESRLERAVSSLIGEMPFLWLEVDDSPGPESRRAYIERNSIALLSNYSGAHADPSPDNWLGNCSPRKKVRLSGLWNQRHVEEDYDPGFLLELENLVSRQVEKGGRY